MIIPSMLHKDDTRTSLYKYKFFLCFPAQASTPPPATDVETLLCRTWNVLNLAVEYQEDGKEGVFREFDNGNLNEVAAYANDQGARPRDIRDIW